MQKALKQLKNGRICFTEPCMHHSTGFESFPFQVLEQKCFKNIKKQSNKHKQYKNQHTVVDLFCPQSVLNVAH